MFFVGESVHEISFELTKEISVRKGETCRARGCAVLAAVSPLCAAHCRARLLSNARRIHLYPYAHKGKKEKV